MCVKLYEFMCTVCVASHGTHGCQVPWGRIIDSSKPSDYGCWKSNQVLSITEPSLQFLFLLLNEAFWFLKEWIYRSHWGS